MDTISTDRIEKQVVIRAPRSRVWRALSDTQQLGQWFGVDLGPGEVANGAQIRGRITHAGYEHLMFDATVERCEPDRLLAWRWHPDPEHPGAEPTTQVTFELTDVEGGTLLTVVESGLAAIPPERRDRVYRGNEEGWSIQVENVKRHVLGDGA